MTAQNLLSQLREKGVELRTSDGDRLVIDAPKGTITDELRDALKTHKTELLQILKSENAPNQPAIAAIETEPHVADKPAIAVTSVSQTEKQVATPTKPPKVAAPAPQTQAEVAAGGMAEEIAQLEAELLRLRTEEEARHAEFETARLPSENALRAEQERWRKAEEDIARRRAEQEKQRIEAEVRERTAEEHRRQIAEQEIARAEEEVKRMRSMEETRRSEVDGQRRAAQQAHESELAALRKIEEEQSTRRAEEERRYLETEARKRAQEEELRRRAEAGFRAVEDQIERVRAREQARMNAAKEARRFADETARRRIEEEARRKVEEEARRRAEEEARLRVEIEAQVRAEAEARRKAEEETRRRVEEEARRRAQEEAERLAAEQARHQAEEEARRRAEGEARNRLEEEARLRAEEEARHRAEEQARLQAEEEARQKAEAEARQRAELEARIRAEVEAKIRAEEAERRETDQAARRRAEHERILAEETAKAQQQREYIFELERPESVRTRSDSNGPGSPEFEIEPAQAEEPATQTAVPAKVTEIAEWFDVSLNHREQAAPLSEDQFAPIHDDADGEFHPVSVPETPFEGAGVSSTLLSQLQSSKPKDRAAALSELPEVGGEDSFHRINAAFDDQAVEVRSAAARALFDFQEDRAAAFTRALREAAPDRRRKIGSAIASSGLANEAIRNLTGESRDKTYDAFSLLFLMSKAGEVQPLMRAIEEHPNIEVRLAVVKLLALSGQPDILPAFRRMAVRGSLPPEVRSAVMEAIYQITSQSPAEAPSIA
ncbi:MAG: hypothetical protein DMF75_03205 [Acidobacteria bacterium]|nr:MAG: hypothetical protein DMF75_03205 [Acidobacteriota bacterium]